MKEYVFGVEIATNEKIVIDEKKHYESKIVRKYSTRIEATVN